jgi:hypothetical protein
LAGIIAIGVPTRLAGRYLAWKRLGRSGSACAAAARFSESSSISMAGRSWVPAEIETSADPGAPSLGMTDGTRTAGGGAAAEGSGISGGGEAAAGTRRTTEPGTAERAEGGATTAARGGRTLTGDGAAAATPSAAGLGRGGDACAGLATWNPTCGGWTPTLGAGVRGGSGGASSGCAAAVKGERSARKKIVSSAVRIGSALGKIWRSRSRSIASPGRA